MSLVIGKERAVSHSCLVASAIDMPEELEEEIENLDDIFQRQMNTINGAAASIRQSLEHPVMKNWPYVAAITTACADRARYIMMNDYIRAMSYGAMRMVNSRLTDVLNAIMPIKHFLDGALEKIREEEKTANPNAVTQQPLDAIKILLAKAAAPIPRKPPTNPTVLVTAPRKHKEPIKEEDIQLPVTPLDIDDDKTPIVDSCGSLKFKF